MPKLIFYKKNLFNTKFKNFENFYKVNYFVVWCKTSKVAITKAIPTNEN